MVRDAQVGVDQRPRPMPGRRQVGRLLDPKDGDAAHPDGGLEHRREGGLAHRTRNVGLGAQLTHARRDQTAGGQRPALQPLVLQDPQRLRWVCRKPGRPGEGLGGVDDSLAERHDSLRAARLLDPGDGIVYGGRVGDRGDGAAGLRRGLHGRLPERPGGRRLHVQPHDVHGELAQQRGEVERRVRAARGVRDQETGPAHRRSSGDGAVGSRPSSTASSAARSRAWAVWSERASPGQRTTAYVGSRRQPRAVFAR